MEVLKKNNVQQLPALKGCWNFNENVGDTFADASGNGHTLIATGKPKHLNENKFYGVTLNGSTQWLSTIEPVLRTDQSFSITAWVRLESLIVNGKLTLKAGMNALTAVSQDSPTHSAFHLGVRRVKKSLSSNQNVELKWCFTVSPIDGSDTGTIECQDAFSESLLDESVIDKWIMLVGVYNVVERSARLYVPNINEEGLVYMPDVWPFWQANGGLQVGRSRWLEQNVDQWPGSIGPIRVFSGVLSSKDVYRLYREDISMK